METFPVCNCAVLAAAKAGKLRPATRKQHCQTSFRFLSILCRPKLAPSPLRRKRIHSPGLCRDGSAQRFAFPKMLVLVTKTGTRVLLNPRPPGTTRRVSGAGDRSRKDLHEG